MKENKLKEKLINGHSVIGPFCKISSTSLVEISALAGFDFVIIDMEHGPVSIESVQNLLNAAQSHGLQVVVRIRENSPSNILQILDIGVQSIQVPQINNVLDAQKVVNSSYYYPKGDRGMCRYVRSASYSKLNKNKYFDSANSEILTIVHIEGIDGINNLKEIMAIDDIDVIFLGPYDLSQSCGFPGQINHPDVINKMKESVKLAKDCKKIIGTFCESPEDVQKWSDIGVQYIAYSVDVGIILDAYTNIINKLKL